VPAAARSTKGAGSKGEHTLGIVLLDCGHPDVVVIHPGKSLARILKHVEWECPDTGSAVTATRVLAVLSEADYEDLTDEEIDLLVSSGAAS
jgi:hypothetical protein